MKPFIWIIDEEWEDYKIEKHLFARELPEYDLKFSGNAFEEDLAEFGTKASAVLCQINISMKRDTLLKLNKAKIVSVYGAGYDNVDVTLAGERNIAVANVPGYCADDVSDYVIAAMYRVNKQLVSYYTKIKNGLWGAQAVKNQIRRLSSQTLFICGLGRIGLKIAQKAKALGMTVTFFDPYVTEDQAKAYGLESLGLEDGLKTSDFVSLNMKLSDETRGMMSTAQFALMKPDAYLINASRGGVVDQPALVLAVKDGVIRGACLDVIEKEPPSYDEEIFRVENIFITPHISYFSQDALDELKTTAAQNIVDYLKNGSCANVVKS
ncbi:C-terminal binding protein [Lachnospiraceae bacterium 54-53]